MPTDRLWKYVSALPALRAEQSLDRINETGAGSGVMEERDQRAYRRNLARVAGLAPPAERATAATLAQIGISVETVPAEAAGKR